MLENLSVRYDPAEDRLVLRFRLREGDEQREHWLHITRRVYAGWRTQLQQMVDLSAQLPPRMDSAAKAVVSSAHHHAVASQVPVRAERPTEATTTAQAVLVTAVDCGRRRKDKRWVLKFVLRDQPPLSLVLGDRTLHALVQAIARRVRVAGWGLKALPIDSAPPAEDDGQGGGIPPPPKPSLH